MYTHVAIQKYALLSVCEVTYQSMKKYYHIIACHKELIGVSLLGLQREGRGRQCDSEPSCSISSEWMHHALEGQIQVLSLQYQRNCLIYSSTLYESISECYTP